MRLSLTRLGPTGSFAKRNSRVPAEIVFAARYFESLRGQAGTELQPFAVLKGEVVTRGSPSESTFVLKQENGGAHLEHTPSIESDTPGTRDKEAQRTVRPRRLLRLELDGRHFQGQTTREEFLLVLPEARPSRHLEVLASLSLGGQPEAAFEVNDVLDVPLVMSSDFPLPPQKATATIEEPSPILLADASQALGPKSATATDATAAAPPARLEFGEGPPTKPAIRHDHGFLTGPDGNLDPSKFEEPTIVDRAALVKWIAKLRGAQLLRPDLVDATNAYEHFLFGGGAEWSFSYDRFVAADASGKKVLESVVDDLVRGALDVHDTMLVATPASPRTDSFQLTSTAVSVGSPGRYPYPATENWQKAIGGHVVWAHAKVTAVTEPSLTRTFTALLTLLAEDMYNFNPGAKDIATGVPDSENGRFEITRLAHEFLSVSSLSRRLDFVVDAEGRVTKLAVSGEPFVPAPAPGSSPPNPPPSPPGP